jgi:hypothetical protein
MNHWILKQFFLATIDRFRGELRRGVVRQMADTFSVEFGRFQPHHSFSNAVRTRQTSKIASPGATLLRPVEGASHQFI